MTSRRLGLVVLGVAVVILGVVSLYWFTRDAAVVDEIDSNDVVAADISLLQPDVDKTGIDAESTQRRLKSLWRIASAEVKSPVPDYPDAWSTDGRVLVDVSEAAASAPTWRVGDRLGVELPQLGVRYEALIERIDEGMGHSRSARALIFHDDGTRKRFVVTVGPTRVFAYIDSFHGPYELIANRQLGWLVPSSSIMASFDFSKPDYLLPERESPPE